MSSQVTEKRIQEYRDYLIQEERSRGTIEKYMRDLRAFAEWLAGREVDRALASQWKEHLFSIHYAPVTINSRISAINGFFRFMGWEEYRIRFLRVQRKLFRDPNRDLKKEEYKKLLKSACRQGKERLALLMETICCTGIRVSEVPYITVEAVRRGQAEIALKGKIRTILLPGKLRRKLLCYAKKQKIPSGQIFVTKTGKGISRRQIWQEMKRLCKEAGVLSAKVFPHNLRHLFAATFYEACRDIVRVADVLGHSSIETTRLYLISSGAEHIRQMESLGLVT